ncbi:unnamed protein product [Ectocarpus sp. 12 AP-2014]
MGSPQKYPYPSTKTCIMRGAPRMGISDIEPHIPRSVYTTCGDRTRKVEGV